jgi:hypothetical protein
VTSFSSAHTTLLGVHTSPTLLSVRSRLQYCSRNSTAPNMSHHRSASTGHLIVMPSTCRTSMDEINLEQYRKFLCSPIPCGNFKTYTPSKLFIQILRSRGYEVEAIKPDDRR